MQLEPREDHFDRRITVSTPLQEAGAYLLTAKMENGNESKVILWVSDTSIVYKQLDGKNLYFIADARTGRPISGANVEFFGYRWENRNNLLPRMLTTNFAEISNANGLLTPDSRDLKNNYNWVVIARSKQRLAYLGFQGVWTNRYHDSEYNQIKVFTMTDRPVYRPKQKVRFKFWIRQAKYDQADSSIFARRTFPIELYNPRGEKIFSKQLRSDGYGGVEGEWEIPSDTSLGQYRLQLRARHNNRQFVNNGGFFRIEEYKKPEFAVTVEAPQKPVMLGEKIQASIKANYYFGSPVTDAKVKYKITRTTYDRSWYPTARWDWLYGSGYWWFGHDYYWYPGWRKWVGCHRPAPYGSRANGFWRLGRQHPPEVVAERETNIGTDGTIKVEIDTEIAKELHGNSDHQYMITAEVRDHSRRTIVGSGNILVARKPFKVFTWVDRGYYRVGDTIRANFQSQTLDRQGVEGKGELTLLRITYDKERQPIETPVRRWNLDTDVEGKAEIRMRASSKGQYRLSYKLTDSEEHTIEGGYLFTIIGDGFDGRDYRFNDIELVTEKRQYSPGEKVNLQINTDRVGSTVLLFIRPANGVYLPPKVIRLNGKSTIHEIGVVQKDMPNFFVEAMSVSDANIHSDMKEIVVPPEKRTLNVEVIPSSKTYLPGEKADVEIKLTDSTGKPFVGSSVVSIYDKSVEYISGGSNVADIKEFFWRWRRHHQPTTQSSLGRHFSNLIDRGKIAMQNIGIFGESVVEETDANGLNFRVGDSRGIVNWYFSGKTKAFSSSLGDLSLPESAIDSKSSSSRSLEKNNSGIAEIKQMQGEKSDLGVDPTAQIQPSIRTQFADTALWVGSLNTNKNGLATVSLNMPENLTTWKVRVWSLGHDTKVGSGNSEIITRKNILVRLQAPRFFVEKDEVVLSANVHNYLKTDKTVDVKLDLPGETLKCLGGLTQKVTITAGGEQRVDWRVKVVAEGKALVRMSAITDEESDAMELSFPCYIHGMLKTESWAGTIRPDKSQASITINVPQQRRPKDSVLELRYSPTLAGAMVDALPYLVDYPYGCTEQTLNRFLPSVIVQKTLLDMNLDLEKIHQKRTNLNAQEIGDDQDRASGWKRFKRNPVFQTSEVQRMVRDGLKRLALMQNSDGGWGWFSGSREQSWPHTTAVVVHGLQIARQSDVAVVPDMLNKGLAWLKRYQQRQVRMIKNAPSRSRPWKQHADDIDAFVYMVLVDAGINNQEMDNYLYRDRTRLSVYSKAMYGLVLHKLEDNEKLAMILRNVSQYLVEDEENETAYLRMPPGTAWWYWYGSEIEANAYYLKLLSRVDSGGKTAPRLVKYLLNNRKHATYWSSTRDTAVCVEAFADYLRASGEMKPDMTVEIWVDGKKKKQVNINVENLFSFDNRLILKGEQITSGSHEVEIKRLGKGPVYFNAYLSNFTLEDHITRAGLEVRVNRKYFKLVPAKKEIDVAGSRGQAIKQRIEKYNRVELKNLSKIVSGDLVEIELEIDSKNDYEYLIFEDMKAAGFEPQELRSGYGNNEMGAYMELRDNRVAFFVRRLARGKHSLSYRMRAEVPGRFSALPARACAMYAPELKANSDEIKIIIEDQPISAE